MLASWGGAEEAKVHEYSSLPTNDPDSVPRQHYEEGLGLGELLGFDNGKERVQNRPAALLTSFGDEAPLSSANHEVEGALMPPNGRMSKMSAADRTSKMSSVDRTSQMSSQSPDFFQ
jgi:hypothetical protein